MITIDVSSVERGHFFIFKGQNRTSEPPVYETDIPDNFDVPAKGGALVVFMSYYFDYENRGVEKY